MSVVDRYRVGAQRRLDFLRDELRDEPWKIAYQEAESCHFFELALESNLAVLRYIRQVNKCWREAVYCGVEQPSEHVSEWLKGGFSHWLRFADEMEESLRNFERRDFHVEQAGEFRQAVESTRLMLGNWIAPLPARSPAMLAEPVSEAEADELRAILEAPPGSPGKLKTNPLVLPEGDPSMLR